MNAMFDYLRLHAGDFLNFWFTMQLQTAGFVLLVLLAERALPAQWATPRFRYLLWTTVLLKAFVPPVIGLPGAEALRAPVFFLAPVEAAANAVAAEAPSVFSAEILILFAVIAGSAALAVVAVWRAFELRRALRDAQPFEHTPAGDWPPVFVSNRIPSPLATGLRNPRIYITPAIAAAPGDILLAVLQHERAHIRRRDGLMVLLQTLVQIVYVLNPLMWMANLRIFRYRELICDEEAMAAAGTRPQDYGRLLVNFAEAQPSRLLQTGTCFFETRRGFVQRISELFNAQQRPALKWKHYIPIVLVALIILPLSWRCSREIEYTETYTEYPPDSTAAAQALKAPQAETGYPVKSKMNYVKQGKLKSMAGPKIVGGMEALSKNVKYPEKAMQQGIEGTVIIEATISDDGPAAEMKVLKSVHPLLDEAALQAVKNVSFTAGHRNGEVLESTISIPIKFRLQ